ncbi:MAG TPA: hypothetical protein VJU86_10535 [Pyrinomonadaceae bacterium]|nr:hypothetical protein [Pyrinomonadaceae bacterium]
MNRPTLRVPLVFPEEPNFVAHFKVDNSLRQINIVSDQERLTRFQLNDKPLMPTSILVISEEPSDRPRPLDLKMSLVVVVRAS